MYPRSLEPVLDRIGITVPSGIETASISTYPDNEIVLGFGKRTLPEQALDLAIRLATTLEGDQLGLDRKGFS